MTEKLLIYIDRLSEEEVIQESLSPSCLDVDEVDLKFTGPVQIQGKAYLTDAHLVLDLSIQAQAMIACSICNEPVKKSIELANDYQTQELSQIKGAVYDYLPNLREAILLEVPSFVECEGNCPKRAELKKYLDQESGDQVTFPFAEMTGEIDDGSTQKSPFQCKKK